MEQRLTTIAGIQPSPEWLTACRQHIDTTHGTTTTEEKNHNGDDHDDDDEVLHQILHADLRHVIRRFDASNNSISIDTNDNDARMADDDIGSHYPSKTLRQCLSQSTPSTSTSTSTSTTSSCTTLPPSFRLMIQIEELLDVSLNAEDRLSHGPASITSPTPIGNQAKRCLKMALSDGYYPDGSTTPPSSPTPQTNNQQQQQQPTTQHHVVIAMEVTPIPNLSVHSSAGIKVLLRGPIPIRFGVLMLDPGNATVLGGCIPGLVRLQRKAMEMAAKLAGVGIDPTVRALIWNPHTGLEEDENEGERESSDVPVSTTTHTNTAVPPHRNPLQPNSNNNNTSTNTRNTALPPPHIQDIETLTNVSHSSGISSRTAINSTATMNPNQQQRGLVIPRRSIPNSSSSHQNRHDPEPLPTSHPTSRSNSGSGGSPPRRSRTNNPYARNTTTTNANNASNQEQRSQPAPKSNNNLSHAIVTRPMNSTNTTTVQQHASAVSSSIDLTSPTTSTSTPISALTVVRHAPQGPHTLFSSSSTAKKSSPKEHRQDAVVTTANNLNRSRTSRSTIQSRIYTTPAPTIPSGTTNNSNNKSDNNNILKSSSTPSSIASSLPTPSTASIPPPTTITTCAFSEPLSFLELRTLLEGIRHDADQYKRYGNKTFVVPSKMHRQQCNLGFNIVKSKNWKTKRRGGDSGKVDKYEYVMTCKMTGANDEDGVICCKLSSAIIEPFMGVAPGDMRKLHRADKEKSNKVVTEGGHQILSELRVLAPCHMKLLYPVEQFQDVPNQIDGDLPVLLFCSRGNSV